MALFLRHGGARHRGRALVPAAAGPDRRRLTGLIQAAPIVPARTHPSYVHTQHDALHCTLPPRSALSASSRGRPARGAP